MTEPDDADKPPLLRAVPVPVPPPKRRPHPSLPNLPMDEVGELARHVRIGLLRRPRSLPVAWMLDDVGAALYEAWTFAPECGLARAEARLIERNAQRIADSLVATTTVVELGPSSGRRKLRLLEALARRAPIAYTALDVSAAMAARGLRQLGDLPGVIATGRDGGIAGIAATLGGRPAMDPRIARGSGAGAVSRSGAALVLWLGSGAGTRDAAGLADALGAIRAQLLPGDAMVLGTDLMKHDSLLLRAYDDPAGIAAAFNRAYLARVNRELGGELDVSWFRHEARWDAAARRIELHLVATQPVHAHITVAGIVVHMTAGESIATASAHMLLPHEPAALAAGAGFTAVAQWIDPTWPYALTVMVAE